MTNHVWHRVGSANKYVYHKRLTEKYIFFWTELYKTNIRTIHEITSFIHIIIFPLQQNFFLKIIAMIIILNDFSGFS